jgi:hypothetical protein
MFHGLIENDKIKAGGFDRDLPQITNVSSIAIWFTNLLKIRGFVLGMLEKLIVRRAARPSV